MKITKKQLIRLIKEQINNDTSDLHEAIFKATDLCKREFEYAKFHNKDSFSNFENLVKKYLGRSLSTTEKNDSEYKRIIKIIDDLNEAMDDIEIAYSKSNSDGLRAKNKFYQLLKRF